MEGIEDPVPKKWALYGDTSVHFDLRHANWIPLRRQSGTLEWIGPARLTDAIDGDPFVAIASVRPDFDAALLEFLIGMFTCALAPEDEDEWFELWKNPPSPERLSATISALPDAFRLDGEGPRAFHDISANDFEESEPVDIAQLLIDAPGEQSVKLNKDHFVKRDQVQRVSRASAAMALITMQTYAPSGGAGNRTSLRGGGPLTTLADPTLWAKNPSGQDKPTTLWHLIWANCETFAQLRARGMVTDDPVATFPWLGPTRTSEKNGGSPTTPSDVDARQAYFGLPRRIRLVFGDPGRCDLTGVEDSVTVTGFLQRPYGTQYVGWHHPLTPHYQAVGESWLPRHGDAESVGWRDWVGLTQRRENLARRPAAAVTHFLEQRARRVGLRNPSVRVVGYDTDNMKARGWIDAHLPLWSPASDLARDRLSAMAQRLTDGTELAATSLLFAVKRALFDRLDDAKGDFGYVKQELWSATENEFYTVLASVAEGATESSPSLQLTIQFRLVLERCALNAFDRFAPFVSASPAAIRRVVGARNDLRSFFRGWTPGGKKLFGVLELPAPTPLRESSTSLQEVSTDPKVGKRKRAPRRKEEA